MEKDVNKCSNCGKECENPQQMRTNLGTNEMKTHFFCDFDCIVEWADRVDSPTGVN